MKEAAPRDPLSSFAGPLRLVPLTGHGRTSSRQTMVELMIIQSQVQRSSSKVERESTDRVWKLGKLNLSRQDAIDVMDFSLHKRHHIINIHKKYLRQYIYVYVYLIHRTNFVIIHINHNTYTEYTRTAISNNAIKCMKSRTFLDYWIRKLAFHNPSSGKLSYELNCSLLIAHT